MSEFLSYAGGALLAIATVPQMVRLLRTRSAHDFGWLFTGLNFVGLSLFAYRSFQIAEWGFFAVNVLTSTFWGLVLVVKASVAREAGAAKAKAAGAPGEAPSTEGVAPPPLPNTNCR